jgi:3-oxoacyl-[acyl-carrier protein] reductase
VRPAIKRTQTRRKGAKALDVQGKVIAVTGAGHGIGRTVAIELSKKGALAALIDINPEYLDDTEKLCVQVGGSPRKYLCNVAKEGEVEACFNQIAADFGHLDGLINNAGIVRDALLVKVKDGKVVAKMPLEKWQAVIDVNLTGVFLCGREAAVKMMENGRGVIVNISSISRAGNFGQSNYTAAKAGVAAMTVTWAKELGRHGIRVAAIAPGFVATPMVMAMKPEARERMTAPTLLGRLGEPEEIAKTVNFIFDNDFLTGRVIEVDGGLRL